MKPSIYELMPKVREAVGAIGKGNRNPMGYNYRGVDDVLNRIGPALTEHGVTTVIEVTHHKTEHLIATFYDNGQERKKTAFRATLRLAVHFYAPDGSHVTTTGAGEGQSINDDKATNKAMATAYKYAVLLGLGIPVDGSALDDPDRDDSGQSEEPARGANGRPRHLAGAR